MIERCLDFPEDRPSIRQVVFLLEQARAEDRDEQMDRNKLELVQALQFQPRNKVMQATVNFFVTSNVLNIFCLYLVL